MRKFKGKRVDNGEWVYGFYTFYNGISYIKSIEYNQRFGCGIDVKPETVGQSTGLTDKDGSEIFESHICNISTSDSYDNGNAYWENGFNLICEVRMVDFAWVFITIRNEEIPFYHLNEIDCKIKIIGNIHDNKELLNR